MGAPVLFGILFFFVLCLGAPDSIKGMVIIAAAVMLIVIAVRFKVLRDRIHLPFLALTLYVLMDGISTFYAVSGKFALREFLKVFLAFMMAVVLLAVSPKKEDQIGKRVAAVLAVCTGIGSLVSIDLISTRWISGAVTWILGHFTIVYLNEPGFTPFTRITSLFSNANIFSGFSGIGILISGGLVCCSREQKERWLILAILYLNTLAFLLTVSLGAYFFMLLSGVVFLFMSPKEHRKQRVVLLIELLVLVGIPFVLIIKKSLIPGHGIQFLPLAGAVVGAVVFCLVDYHINKRIDFQKKSTGKPYAAMIAVLIIVVYAVTSLLYTTGITIDAGTSVERAVHPETGTYSLELQTDGNPVEVLVYCQNLLDAAMMNTGRILYQGNAYDAVFSVPEDAETVFFVFSAENAARISSASFGKYRISLAYPLLPEIITSRLNSHTTYNSMALRLVYFQDSMKLFRRSPVIGLGLGAFENGFRSVQSFFYETKYVHNHYLQTMLETGIVGLLLFLFLLISSAVAVWKSRKEQPFAPMLAALWVFMAGQAIHDVVFSSYAYLPLAYGSFVMIDLCCGEAITKPKLGKTFKTVLIAGISLLSVVYCGFVASNLLANRNYKKDPSFQTLTKCVEMDCFEWADYALQYVYSATDVDVPTSVRKQADEYAERLAQVNSNTVPIYLAEYYFTSDRTEQGLAMLEKYVDYVPSDQDAWREVFDMLRTYEQDTEAFRDGVLRLAEKMETWNANNFGKVYLTDEQTAFVEAYR